MGTRAVLFNDPEEMLRAREASWLCDIFQENQLNLRQKQKIIRETIKDYIKKKKESEV